MSLSVRIVGISSPLFARSGKKFPAPSVEEKRRSSSPPSQSAPIIPQAKALPPHPAPPAHFLPAALASCNG